MENHEFHKAILDRLDAIDSKVNPMYEVFTSVNGFSRISVFIMKILAGIGIALAGLYTLIEFFKKLGK